MAGFQMLSSGRLWMIGDSRVRPFRLAFGNFSAISSYRRRSSSLIAGGSG
jgi:hypothetical protein